MPKAENTIMEIRYARSATPFGFLLVAATVQGLCSVSLGESEERLMGELVRDFPHADLIEDPEQLASYLIGIEEHLQGFRPDLDLPVDLVGTEFQMRVWRALQEIPFGSTRSYREVAESIGRPTAARAVARACASNRVALVVPCHRVVRQGGDPGGYRWGIEVKRGLLERERKLSR